MRLTFYYLTNNELLQKIPIPITGSQVVSIKMDVALETSRHQKAMIKPSPYRKRTLKAKACKKSKTK